MNRTKWLKKLNKLLKKLNTQERTDAVEYYKEIFMDKSELGMSDADIISELGSPAECAQKIIAESGKAVPKTSADYNQNTNPGTVYFVLKIFLIIILMCIFIAAIISLGAIALSGIAIAFSGISTAITAPLFSANVLTTQGIVFHIGLGVVVCALGTIVFAVFGWLTKHTAVFSFRFIKSVYQRGAR